MRKVRSAGPTSQGWGNQCPSHIILRLLTFYIPAFLTRVHVWSLLARSPGHAWHAGPSDGAWNETSFASCSKQRKASRVSSALSSSKPNGVFHTIFTRNWIKSLVSLDCALLSNISRRERKKLSSVGPQ